MEIQSGEEEEDEGRKRKARQHVRFLLFRTLFGYQIVYKQGVARLVPPNRNPSRDNKSPDAHGTKKDAFGADAGECLRAAPS